MIVRASENKFNHHGMHPSLHLDEVDYLITNKKLEDQFARRFEGTKVNVFVTGEN